MLFTAPVWSADVVITWSDSVVIEDAEVRENTPTINFGRVNYAGRPGFRLNESFGNLQDRVAVRCNTVKDSTDLHAGLIIDSMYFAFIVMDTAVAGGSQTAYVRAFAIATDRDWVEGNGAGGTAAANCEISFDSAQAVGAGSCASKQAWAIAGMEGAADTMSGVFGAKPSDSFLVNASTAIGDTIKLWIDTAAVNLWMASDANNEGIVFKFTSEDLSTATLHGYSSEYNGAGRADSIPLFRLYGHTAVAGAAKKLGAVKLGDAKL